ncbi:hypothetical protein [Dyadobacter sp. MSC1_007]|jgi:hypothetical protein|uniref:hypothetical protein n=1 Tax=Dyadobacter sp. MSC1_007 TaxID=2909264 RepID=UPI002030DED4|nr:hypothetical protein [Dyadobacter sp. MSC1_007]
MNARIIIILLFCSMHFSHAQEITTSATCGKCGRIVSSTSNVGDQCPYCHVVWNRENTRRYDTTVEPPKYNYGSSKSDYKTSRTPLHYFKLRNSLAVYYRDYNGIQVGGFVYQPNRFAGTEIKDKYAFIRYSDEDGGAAIGWVKLSDLIVEDGDNEREIDYSELAQKIGEETYQEVIRRGRDPFESNFETVYPDGESKTNSYSSSESNLASGDQQLPIPDVSNDTLSSNNSGYGDTSVIEPEKSIEQLAKEEGARVYWSVMLRNFLIVIGGAILVFLFQQGSKTKPS